MVSTWKHLAQRLARLVLTLRSGYVKRRPPLQIPHPRAHGRLLHGEEQLNHADVVGGGCHVQGREPVRSAAAQTGGATRSQPRLRLQLPTQRGKQLRLVRGAALDDHLHVRVLVRRGLVRPGRLSRRVKHQHAQVALIDARHQLRRATRLVRVHGESGWLGT